MAADVKLIGVCRSVMLKKVSGQWVQGGRRRGSYENCWRVERVEGKVGFRVRNRRRHWSF